MGGGGEGRVVISVPWEVDAETVAGVVAGLASGGGGGGRGWFGRRLAEAVRPVYERYGGRYGWNALWAVAARAAGLVRRGYGVGVVEAAAVAVAGEYGVPRGVARELVEAVVALFRG